MIGPCGAADREPAKSAMGGTSRFGYCFGAVPNCLETWRTSAYIRLITALDLACGMSGD
jgi:hypothetical protein